MKKIILPLAVTVAAGLLLVKCQKKFEWSPTYAVPIAHGSMTVADIVGARPSEVQGVQDQNGLTFYQLEYIDTLPSITKADFPGAGNVPAGASFTMEEKDVFLRMTGKAENGTFRFTDPRVEFSFINSLNMDLELELQNTYTRNVKTGSDFAFSISNQPWFIPEGTEATPIDTNYEVNNANTDSALTEVFSPAPKYLYYTPKLTAPSGESNLNDGKMDIISKVILPFEGAGSATRRDTLKYNYQDSLFSYGVEGFEGSAGMGDFAIMRMNFTNGIPLQVVITGYVVDTADYLPLADLPLFDEGDDQTTLIVSGAEQTTTTPPNTPTTVPVERSIEIRLEREKTIGVMNLDDLEEGNAIILEMTFSTTNYSNSVLNPIKVFSDQTLDFNMGIRVNGEAKFERPALKDLF